MWLATWARHFGAFSTPCFPLLSIPQENILILTFSIFLNSHLSSQPAVLPHPCLAFWDGLFIGLPVVAFLYQDFFPSTTRTTIQKESFSFSAKILQRLLVEWWPDPLVWPKKSFPIQPLAPQPHPCYDPLHLPRPLCNCLRSTACLVLQHCRTFLLLNLCCRLSWIVISF